MAVLCELTLVSATNAQQTNAVSTSTVELRAMFWREIAQAFGDAGESIARIAEGIERAVESGLRVYDLVEARRAYSRIEEYRLILAKMTGYNIGVLMALERYIDDALEELANLDDTAETRYDLEPVHTAGEGKVDPWTGARRVFGETLALVKEIEEMLSEERSDFVAQEIYTDLVITIQKRADTLNYLLDIPAPTTKLELIELKKVFEEYGLLVNNLRRFNDALAKYMRELKKSSRVHKS